MAFDTNQVEELKSCYPALAEIADGQQCLILISALQMPPDCTPQVVDALLCPVRRDNYSSRLFLSEKVQHKGTGQNWNALGVAIVGRKWWAVSWAPKSDKQRLLEMVIDHLEAFRCKP